MHHRAYGWYKQARDEPVIIWNTRDPLAGRSPGQFEQEVKGMLSGRVEAAYVFGSYGTKDFGRDSDVDLLLVVQTDKPFVERALDFTDIIDLVPDMDLLVYTPEEFRKLTGEPSPDFWTSVVASMRRVV
jgi:hypothetical protein